MLKTLSVRNFRNLNIPQIKFSSGFTAIIGENGQGKTNLLEAIYCLSYGKSFRGSREQVINWSSDEARVFGETEGAQIEVRFKRDNSTRFFINGKRKSLFSLLGRFVSVVFHPAEIEIISGPPTLRRSWLNRAIGTANKTYLYALANYHKSLQNKNKLLKTKKFSTEEIEIWNNNLVNYGTKIWQGRERLILDLNQLLKYESTKLIGKEIRVEYKSPLAGLEEKEAQKNYLKKLTDQQEIERRVGVTIFGPHRDDFKIIMDQREGNNIIAKDLAAFGSRAEQRQAILALKVVEAKIHTKFFGRPPTILLDDVASELDRKNRDLLLSRLSARQVIITATSLQSFSEKIKSKSQVYLVENGSVVSD